MIIIQYRYDCEPEITTQQDVIQGLHESVQVLMDHLSNGHYVYGNWNTLRIAE
jgi:hypothetical protein